jgi:hypothetical protein
MKDYILSDSMTLVTIIGELERLRGEVAKLERENKALRTTVNALKPYSDSVERERTRKRIEELKL